MFSVQQKFKPCPEPCPESRRAGPASWPRRAPCRSRWSLPPFGMASVPLCGTVSRTKFEFDKVRDKVRDKGRITSAQRAGKCKLGGARIMSVQARFSQNSASSEKLWDHSVCFSEFNLGSSRFSVNRPGPRVENVEWLLWSPNAQKPGVVP